VSRHTDRVSAEAILNALCDPKSQHATRTWKKLGYNDRPGSGKKSAGDRRR
jgi:hypothetical protein